MKRNSFSLHGSVTYLKYTGEVIEKATIIGDVLFLSKNEFFGKFFEKTLGACSVEEWNLFEDSLNFRLRSARCNMEYIFILKRVLKEVNLWEGLFKSHSGGTKGEIKCSLNVIHPMIVSELQSADAKKATRVLVA